MDLGRVFVAGSINMDVVATAERHPKVGETVAGKAVLYFPGGKGANQAVAAARLGASTTLIGRVGKDAFGQQLRAYLAAEGVDLTFVKDAEAHTGTAIITVANADNTIVVVPGANAMVDAIDVAAPVLAQGDVAVSQFEIPLPTITAFFRQARAAGATTILNPAPAMRTGAELLGLVDILILNETELGFLTGTELHDSDDHARFTDAARSLAWRGQDRLRHARQARRAGADRRRASGRSRPRRHGGRHHRRRRLLRRCAGRAACRPQFHSRRTALRQHRRFDLRATDGRGAVNADGGRGSSRPLQPSSRRKPGPITPGSSFAEGVCHRRLAERSRGVRPGSPCTIAHQAGRHRTHPSARFRSKLASAACSGVIERPAASNLRPNMWSPARFTNSIPSSCSPL